MAQPKEKDQHLELEKLDSESKNRTEQLNNKCDIIVSIIAVSWTVFQLYTGFFGLLPAILQRGTTAGFGLLLTFLCYKGFREKDARIRVYDWILAALSFSCILYLYLCFDQLTAHAGKPTTSDVIMGCIMIVLVLEATRRSVGTPLVIVALVFLLYAFAGPWLPGLLRHKAYSLARVASQLYITIEGLFGTPMSVMTTFVFAFVLFGCFLESTGGAKIFIDLAFAMTGKMKGGPAKTAVVASGLLGTISGSSLANVVTTGSFTIPLMKKCGYKPSFAGGVEASASSAGQIMPPVMGAAAFIMAESTGIPYLRICAAAVIPAVLYYLAVLLSVDLEARRMGIDVLSKEEIPQFGSALMKSIPLLLPLVTIIVLLIMGYTPLKAALYATIVMIIGSFFQKETRMTPKVFYSAIKRSALSAIGVTVACTVCGIVTGIITLTGLGLKLSDLILQVSGGIMLPTMLLTMVASIILGMGLPTTAKYIVLSAVAAPAMTKLGIPLIAAHMFILYFGVIAEVTPPVALTSYAGAAIAKAPGVETALQGLRISIAAFFIPFMFCYYPSLLFESSTLTGFMSGLCSAFIGVTCLATASIGYFFGRLSVIQRLVLFVGTFLVIIPSLTTDLIGLVIILVVYFWQKKKQKKQKGE